ncbi:unnamed protein product [Aphanomyces euteiches]
MVPAVNLLVPVAILRLLDEETDDEPVETMTTPDTSTALPDVNDTEPLLDTAADDEPTTTDPVVDVAEEVVPESTCTPPPVELVLAPPVNIALPPEFDPIACPAAKTRFPPAADELLPDVMDTRPPTPTRPVEEPP